MSKGSPRVRTLMWVWSRQSNSCCAIAQARTSTACLVYPPASGSEHKFNATMPRGTHRGRGISSNSTQSTPYTQTRRGRWSAPWVQQQPSAVPLPTPPVTSQPDLASQRIADLTLQGLVSIVRAIVQEDRAVAALSTTMTAGGIPPSGSTSAAAVALSGSTPLPLLTSASPVTSSLAHPGTSGGLPEHSGASMSWSTLLLTSTLPVTTTLTHPGTSGGFPGSSGGMC